MNKLTNECARVHLVHFAVSGLSTFFSNFPSGCCSAFFCLFVVVFLLVDCMIFHGVVVMVCSVPFCCCCCCFYIGINFAFFCARILPQLLAGD